MQIQCKQVVLIPVIDEDIFDKEAQLDICKSLYKKRTTFAGTIKRDGSTTRYDKLRITAISEERFLDILSIGPTHTLTLKRIPFENIVSISITGNNPIDSEDAKSLTIDDFLDI
tara:strand:+ start:30152 stop:30493 length:342 start_codon:yes stop_codon:yes gene_type:complete